jgi:hypothetical protein
MLAIGLLSGLAASALFNVGVALQALEARATPPDLGLRPSLLVRLLGRPRWVLGLLLGGIGVPLEVVAFANAPFIVVQPILAAGLLILLLLGSRLLHERIGGAVLVGVLAIVAGTALIAWGAPAHTEHHRGATAVIAVSGGLVLVSLIPFALRGSRFDTPLVPNLGSACGFAATNVAAKLMADNIGAGHLPRAAAWLGVAAFAGRGPDLDRGPDLPPGRAGAAVPDRELGYRAAGRRPAPGRPAGDGGRHGAGLPHPRRRRPLRRPRGLRCRVPFAAPDAVDANLPGRFPAIGPLADEAVAQRSRDRGAGDVGLVVVDLHSLDARGCQRRLGQRRRDPGRVAAAQEGDVDPVADLQRAGATAAVQAATAGDPAVGEDAEQDVAARAPFALPAGQHRQSVFERQRLQRDPGHPWLQVGDVFDDRLVLGGCVGDRPAAQEQAIGLDAIGQPIHRRKASGLTGD